MMVEGMTLQTQPLLLLMQFLLLRERGRYVCVLEPEECRGLFEYHGDATDGDVQRLLGGGSVVERRRHGGEGRR